MLKRMNKILLTLLFSLFHGLALYGSSSDQSDSIRFEVLLNGTMLSEDSLNLNFLPTFEITSSQLVLLSSPNQFYLLGWGGIAPTGHALTDSMGSFTYTPDGYLVIVSKNRLGFIDSLGKFEVLYHLPDESMRIAPGENVLYIYDRGKTKEKYPLYALAKGGLSGVLFELPTPISAVAEINKTILFSTGNSLFAFNPKTKEVEAIAAIETDAEIISIAVNPKSNTIYLASKTALYTVKENGIELITPELGGMIKYINGSLFLFNAEKQFLLRMVGIEK